MAEADGQGQASSQSSQSGANQSNSADSGAASANNSQQATQNSNGAANQSQATTEPAKRPAYVPETHWDGTTGKIKDEGAFAKFVNDHVAFKAADDSRRLTLPQKPEDYKLALTPNFKAPQGIEFVPNENDPILPQARAFALKHGLSQDAFAELVDLRAAIDIGNRQLIDNAKAAELQKLGPTGTARKTAIDTWLTATLGDELGMEMLKYTFSAKQVQAIEKLMDVFRTQGVAPLDQRHRETGDPQKVSDEVYDKMSFAEKREYAAQFGNPTAQPLQQQANGR